MPRVRTASNRVIELDGVRGLAILSVLTWHYGITLIQTTPGSIPAYFLKLLSFTWAGVDIFFVLSGFLIGGILLNYRETPNYFRTFYIRRVCRIFPIYFLVLGAYLLVLAAVSKPLSPASKWLIDGPMPIWSYALFVQNVSMAIVGQHGANWLGVTWSLAIEEQFYLILPLIIRFIPISFLPRVLWGLVIVAPVFRTSLFFIAEHKGFPGFLLLPARWDSLLLGVLAAHYLRSEVVTTWLMENPAKLLASLFVMLCGTMALIAFGQGIGSLGMSVFGHTWLALLGVNVIFVALFVKWSIAYVFFRARALAGLGTISYGVYLYHQPVSGICYHLFTNHRPYIGGISDVFVTLLALAVTLVLAIFSWRYIERPIVGFGHSISYRSARPVALGAVRGSKYGH